VFAAISNDEQIGAPAISAVFELVRIFLERRYGRYATTLSGPVREEV
jgi:hypothetical protein